MTNNRIWKPITEFPLEMKPVIAKTEDGTVGIAYVYCTDSGTPQWNFTSLGMNKTGLINEKAMWMDLPGEDEEK